MNRRDWIRATAAAAAAGFAPGFVGCGVRESGSGVDPEPTVRFPGKVEMRVINDRPPCLETPWRFYREDFTPNHAFYVRWHLQAFPTSIDLASWRLRIGGNVERPLELSIDDLKKMDRTTIAAVNQCSGNSRSLFQPRVTGAQWRNGAMGNAKWTGVRLRDLLKRAGLKAGAVDVVFDGLDEGPLPGVPDFLKSLKADHALEAEPLVAFEMNGEPLPALNGFPARLVVPGWYATYWVKALTKIEVWDKSYDGYWMAKAYKIPANPRANESPDRLDAKIEPINRLNVRSFFTSPDRGSIVVSGTPITLSGIAFDGGSGIKRVEVSFDDGRTWRETMLGEDHGRFSFRRWKLEWTPTEAGERKLLVRATNRSDETQTADPIWNRGGFMRNVIESLAVVVV